MSWSIRLILILPLICSRALVMKNAPIIRGGRSQGVVPMRMFFGSFGGGNQKEADAKLDTFVSSAKAVLFTDGTKTSEEIKTKLKTARVGNFKEVRLDQEEDANALKTALKRRVGTVPPTLVISGTVLDKKRIDYLIQQDMMLPVFRAAGTSGEVRLPFQDLRFYLSKTMK